LRVIMRGVASLYRYVAHRGVVIHLHRAEDVAENGPQGVDLVAGLGSLHGQNLKQEIRQGCLSLFSEDALLVQPEGFAHSFESALQEHVMAEHHG